MLNLVVPSFGQYASGEAAAGPVQALQIDDLGWLVLGVVLLSCVLLVPALPGTPRTVSFLLLMAALAFSTFLLVSTTNLIGFLFLWEFTAMSAWGVGKLGLRGSNSVLGALPVNAVGSIASISMFAFVALLVVQSGSLEFSALKTTAPSLLMALLLMAILLKAFGLLSNAWFDGYEVAFPVSNALVAGGGVVAVGVYPFLRFGGDLMRRSADAQHLVLWTSLVIALLFALAALQENDFFRLASFLAFSQFCLALAGFALNTQQALYGAVFTFITGAFASLVLFLAVGIVCQSSAARSLTDLGGLLLARPGPALLLLVAVAAASALPPFGTFVGKIAVTFAMLGHSDSLVAILWITSWTVTALFLFRAVAIALFPPSRAVSAEAVHLFSAIPIVLGTAVLLSAAVFPSALFSFLEPAISGLSGWQ